MNRNARTTDPATSHAAAAPRPTHAARLLAAYRTHPEGLTADQAAHLAGLSHTGYWKRVSDLIRDGHIIPLLRDGQPYAQKGDSGYQQRVCVAADALDNWADRYGYTIDKGVGDE